MRASNKNLALICGNLGELYNDGIEIVMAIELLSDLPISKAYKDSLINIRNDVIKGKGIAEAFKNYSLLYPSFFTGMLGLGEKSGQLGKVLNSMQEYYEHIDKVKKKTISSLIYPAFLITALIVLLIILVFVVIPNFEQMFDDNGLAMPAIVKLLQSFRKLCVQKPILFIACLVSWGIGIPILILKSSKIKSFIMTFVNNLKIMKQINEYIFVLILSIILKSGIPLINGLEIVSETLEFKTIVDKLEIIKNDILIGDTLSSSLEKSNILSKYSISMIGLGEISGGLVEKVSKLELRMENLLNEKIEKLIGIIEPVMITIMGVSIAVFICIFVLPMFDVMYGGVN